MICNEKFIINMSIKKLDVNKIFLSNFLGKEGAIVSFIGIVKEFCHNKKVVKINYVVFEDLAYSLLEKKCVELLKNFENSKILVYQYVGELSIKGYNSIIIVNSINRKNAFFLCSELLEYLKSNVPIWKKEYYSDGTHKWINSDIC